MTEDDIADALDDYDHFVENIMGAGYTTFEDHIGRFFGFVKDDPVISILANRVTVAAEFDDWYEKAKATRKGMVGSGTLDWPSSTDERLGLWLGLVGALADGKETIVEFCSHFLYSGSHFDDMVQGFSDQIFDPFSRDFRRLVSNEAKRIARETTNIDDLVPVSDGYVTLEHNSPEYIRAVEALDAVIREVRGSNEYGDLDPDDQEQKIAELEAGKRLFQALRVRPRAIVTVVGTALLTIGVIFTTGVISAAASTAWEAIKIAIGL